MSSSAKSSARIVPSSTAEAQSCHRRKTRPAHGSRDRVMMLGVPYSSLGLNVSSNAFVEELEKRNETAAHSPGPAPHINKMSGLHTGRVSFDSSGNQELESFASHHLGSVSLSNPHVTFDDEVFINDMAKLQYDGHVYAKGTRSKEVSPKRRKKKGTKIKRWYKVYQVSPDVKKKFESGVNTDDAFATALVLRQKKPTKKRKSKKWIKTPGKNFDRSDQTRASEKSQSDTAVASGGFRVRGEGQRSRAQEGTTSSLSALPPSEKVLMQESKRRAFLQLAKAVMEGRVHETITAKIGHADDSIASSLSSTEKIAALFEYRGPRRFRSKKRRSKSRARDDLQTQSKSSANDFLTKGNKGSLNVSTNSYNIPLANNSTHSRGESSERRFARDGMSHIVRVKPQNQRRDLKQSLARTLESSQIGRGRLQSNHGNTENLLSASLSKKSNTPAVTGLYSNRPQKLRDSETGFKTSTVDNTQIADQRMLAKRQISSTKQSDNITALSHHNIVPPSITAEVKTSETLQAKLPQVDSCHLKGLDNSESRDRDKVVRSSLATGLTVFQKPQAPKTSPGKIIHDLKNLQAPKTAPDKIIHGFEKPQAPKTAPGRIIPDFENLQAPQTAPDKIIHGFEKPQAPKTAPGRIIPDFENLQAPKIAPGKVILNQTLLSETRVTSKPPLCSSQSLKRATGGTRGSASSTCPVPPPTDEELRSARSSRAKLNEPSTLVSQQSIVKQTTEQPAEEDVIEEDQDEQVTKAVSDTDDVADGGAPEAESVVMETVKKPRSKRHVHVRKEEPKSKFEKKYRKPLKFDGWDDGKALAEHTMTSLPDYTDVAAMLLQRAAKQKERETMLLTDDSPSPGHGWKPREADGPKVYLARHGIQELFTNLTASVLTELPKRPVEHMQEVTRNLDKQAQTKADITANFPFLRSEESRERLRHFSLRGSLYGACSGNTADDALPRESLHRDARSDATVDILSDSKVFMQRRSQRRSGNGSLESVVEGGSSGAIDGCGQKVAGDPSVSGHSISQIASNTSVSGNTSYNKSSASKSNSNLTPVSMSQAGAAKSKRVSRVGVHSDEGAATSTEASDSATKQTTTTTSGALTNSNGSGGQIGGKKGRGGKGTATSSGGNPQLSRGEKNTLGKGAVSPALSRSNSLGLGKGAVSPKLGKGGTSQVLGRGANNATLGRGASNATIGGGASNATLGRGASNATLGRGASNATLGRGASNATLVTVATCSNQQASNCSFALGAVFQDVGARVGVPGRYYLSHPLLTQPDAQVRVLPHQFRVGLPHR
ncbi:hypothetical protein ElyMa_006354600 [Elysia marginata]|uniref:Uncharacterized protein n=1 Tax=Elysia marginata TaxID=1093978 RepID=A0AAV4HLQ2_9GAST|nr:hypothetical protein ElyMa_006354600 [Elysia marginata]